MEGVVRVALEAMTDTSYTAIVEFNDASHGSKANQRGAAPNEGITSAVGARVGAALASGQIVDYGDHTFALLAESVSATIL